jgi:hypothetical protein
MKMFMKLMVSLLVLVQVVGLSAMDVGEPSNLILRNSSGYAVQLRWSVLSGGIIKGMPLIVLDNRGEENLGPIDKVWHIAFSSYGEILGQASLGWYQYSSDEIAKLRPLAIQGKDIIIEIKTDRIYRFFADFEHPKVKDQQAAGAVQAAGMSKGMAFLQWFPRVKNKLIISKKYTLDQLESMELSEIISAINKEMRVGGVLNDYLFLGLIPDSKRQDIQSRFEYLHNKLVDTLKEDPQVAKTVESYLRSARDGMLSRIKE